MSDISVALSPRTEIQQAFDLQNQHKFVTARSTASQRIAKLKRLHDAMLRYREDIKAAVWQDFRKNATETDISELGVVNTEIRQAIRNLRSWMAHRQVDTPLPLIGSSSEIRYEPKGVCLILSPWNFPFNLTFSPLVLAIAAGNCVVVKPSEYAPASSALMKKMLAECFPPEEVAVFEGDAMMAQELLLLPFNHIFFTGSPAIGKVVMGAAAKHLASVTLELGGKNPVIVDETANLDICASKLVWTRMMNAGQSCISPDYVLVHENVQDALVQKIGEKIRQFFGDTAEAQRNSPDYCRLISDRHFGRVTSLIHEAVQRGARVAHGGESDAATRYVQPTVLTHIPEDATIWNEEVFGPVLSVRSYKTLQEAIAYIGTKPTPLASYMFSGRNRDVKYFLNETRSGGVTVNDCEIHFFNTELPFGGMNNSGIGKTHGKFGFLEFSNARGVCYQNRFFPGTNLFHPPYRRSRLANLIVEAVVKWF